MWRTLPWNAVPIGSAGPIADFQCRDGALQSFLLNNALRFEEAGYSRCYVWQNPEPAGPPILGYYAISMSKVTTGDVPPAQRAPVTPLPAALPVGLVAQLARDARANASLHIGRILMGEALRRIALAAETIGCAGIALDALNQQLVTYYERYNFEAIGRPTFPRKMYVPLATVREGLEAVEP